MSLNTALSGLLGAQTAIDVASNNLANATTVGFKSGSAEFADLFPPAGTNSPGQGVMNQFTQVDYSEGNLETTGNALDLAVQGTGMFMVQKNGQTSYTRDGAFQVSPSGTLQNANGSSVLGFGVNSSGQSDGIIGPLSIEASSDPAKASSSISLNTALNSADPAIASAFNPADPTTYDESTSVVAYDSLGNANHVQLYFVKKPASGATGPGVTTPNDWTVYAQPRNSNGSAIGAPTALSTLAFNASGGLTSGGTATLNVDWGNGAAASNIAFNLAGTNVGAQSFAVNSTTNNGYPPGTYSGTSVTAAGAVQASYSNGKKQTVGTLALASFINDQGLIPVSGNLFQTSEMSGQPVANAPGAGVNGSVKSGALEQSNTDTSTELVNLIQFQESYQANTSVLQGEQQDTAKLLQLG